MINDVSNVPNVFESRVGLGVEQKIPIGGRGQSVGALNGPSTR